MDEITGKVKRHYSALPQNSFSVFPGYDAKRLARFYDYHPQLGAVNYNIYESQYGIKDSEIVDPTRHYFFYVKLLTLIKNSIPSGAVVLDIGCGDGVVAAIAVSKVKRYIGIDISMERIRRCRQNIKSAGCFFVVADALRLPFKESAFTLVMALEAIEHLPKTDLFLKEVRRMLSKRGLFLISTPQSLFFENNIDALYKNQHLYGFSVTALKAWLMENSFSIISITGIGFQLPKITIPLWLGSKSIKFLYAKITSKELKSGYGKPISLQCDIISNPFLNRLYFKLRNKKLWFRLLDMFGMIGRYIPQLSSDMVFICQK